MPTAVQQRGLGVPNAETREQRPDARCAGLAARIAGVTGASPGPSRLRAGGRVAGRDRRSDGLSRRRLGVGPGRLVGCQRGADRSLWTVRENGAPEWSRTTTPFGTRT